MKTLANQLFHTPAKGRAGSGGALSHATIRSVTIPREVLAITLVLVAAFGSGCGVAGPSACTLIGCTGLVVEVTGAPGQTPVTVVVTAPDGSTRSTTCTPAMGTCAVSFSDFTPASVTIRVSTGTQTTEVTRQPMYRSHPTEWSGVPSGMSKRSSDRGFVNRARAGRSTRRSDARSVCPRRVPAPRSGGQPPIMR